MIAKNNRMKARPHHRVLLDTNIWRYIADEAAFSDLLKVARDNQVHIQVAPSVLYEALASGDRDLRRRLVFVLTDPHWKRLMPEAYTESQELLDEIRRLRPNWIRMDPDHTLYRRLRFDWTRSKGSCWDRARHEPDLAAEAIAAHNGDTLIRARTAAKLNRDTHRSFHFNMQSIQNARVEPTCPIPGWHGDRIEFWRGTGCSSTIRALRMRGHPYVDWLSGEVNIALILRDAESWTQFWFYDVRPDLMSRFWIRGTFEYLQSFRKITDGSPGDVQLATYLPESDLFLTADKAFVEIAECCRQSAPFHMAHTHLIPGGRKGVDCLLSRLSVGSESKSRDK